MNMYSLHCCRLRGVYKPISTHYCNLSGGDPNEFSKCSHPLSLSPREDDLSHHEASPSKPTPKARPLKPCLILTRNMVPCPEYVSQMTARAHVQGNLPSHPMLIQIQQYPFSPDQDRPPCHDSLYHSCHPLQMLLPVSDILLYCLQCFL